VSFFKGCGLLKLYKYYTAPLETSDTFESGMAADKSKPKTVRKTMINVPPPVVPAVQTPANQRPIKKTPNHSYPVRGQESL
jgi:hypothetical protein